MRYYFNPDDLLVAINKNMWYSIAELNVYLMSTVCSKCGKSHAIGMGLWGMLNNDCLVNKHIYRPGSLTMRKLKNAFRGIDPLKSFDGLAEGEYLKPMPNITKATLFEKKQYFHLRQLDIKWAMQMNKYIELEKEMDSRW